MVRSREPLGMTDSHILFHYFNPLVTSGLSRPYHLDESTFNFRSARNDFSIVISFFEEIHMARNTLSRNIDYTQTFLILFEQE